MGRLFAGATLLALVLAGGAAAAEERVDLQLVFLADATGSIDEAEIRFQREGYATALTDPNVLSAIAQGFNQRIAVTYVEWGDAGSQEVVVPWTIIDGAGKAAAFAQVLRQTPRLAFGRNAIGSAIAMAQALIETNGLTSRRKVIDLSADSANNFEGVPLADARDRAVAAGIVINGLAILCRDCSGRPVSYDLETAFEQRIIGGHRSFVITADGNQRFAAAVRKKMLLEIAGAPPPGRGRPAQEARR